MQGGLRTIATRSIPDRGTFKKSSFKIVTGYIFHIGLLVTIFFYTPHILFFKDIFGFSWPAVPSAVVDALAMVSIITLIAILFDRLRNPVTRFLTTPEDLLIWFVTIFPLITGYMAFHRTGLSGPGLLGLHLLSVELLLVVFPFTKLMHAFTLIMARWYNGAVSGYKGVAS
jgi:nitrate reductase gamma subunit